VTRSSPLRLLAPTNNARGDLFTRLISDLFFALGYDELRFDLHKSGREIDISGTHRLLPRRLVAECKAHADKIGGDDLNKFYGVLTRERGTGNKKPVDGFFVSLGGFRETGIEQEKETDEQSRVILLDGAKVVEELIRGRILIGETGAVERAGRCCAQSGIDEVVGDGTELLGCPLGYVWAVYFALNKQRTHFALIHADGTPLAETVAEDIVATDRKSKGTLHKLTYVPPPAPLRERETVLRTAFERYREWVVHECGEIQLDGLPADADLSAFRMKLERLFVPMKIVGKPDESPEDGEKPAKNTKQNQESVFQVGDFLAEHPRFSLLAKPGGGKSTLLKRIAVAYADPKRRQETDDRLPDRDWLPLLLRCRELRDRAHRPIRELLEELSTYAGLNCGESEVFRDGLDEALRSGRALLLVDGLDEISDEGTRTTFAQHLRTLLAMFPRVAMVVTSREAGYRHVAGVVASVCEQVRMAPFEKDDVTRLCESWHTVVVDDTEAVRADSRKLAETIWENSRIRPLAENPLMLTTLLVVRRCIGDLPTRRVELYHEAVKVLIRTWNTEGYAAMDLDETLAQLSYVAVIMMNEGIQRIGHRRLLELLNEAREELQAELQFTKISPAEFVERVEYRSSLLMQTGHERIDGELQPIYEFRHLTFQEYLAARGLTEEQYPGRDQNRTLLELLEPHFKDESWREVIPLAAVLAGRKAEPTIRRLTDLCANIPPERISQGSDDKVTSADVLLRQCLLDEVSISTSILRGALRQLARLGSENALAGSIINLRRGRFGDLFHEIVQAEYWDGPDGWEDYSTAMKDLAWHSVFPEGSGELTAPLVTTLDDWLTSTQRADRVRAALVYMRWAYLLCRTDFKAPTAPPPSWPLIRKALLPLLSPDDPRSALPAAWAFVWLGQVSREVTPVDFAILHALYRLCRESKSRELQRLSGWAFGEQPLLARDAFPIDIWGDCDAWLEETVNQEHEDKFAPVVVAWYRRGPWSDSRIAELVKKFGRSWQNRRDLLAALGVVENPE
jgi:hypothetical protein